LGQVSISRKPLTVCGKSPRRLLVGDKAPLSFPKILTFFSAAGVCECPSLVGPLLGGGFGKLQGFHGLIMDNTVSLDVVLANGTLVTASESSHPDLFWAMRGAGHNFAIVTRMRQRIYDPPVKSWFYAELQFTENKLEEFTDTLNAFNAGGMQPKEIAFVQSFIHLDPSVSDTELVIQCQFTYAGSEDEASPYLDQLIGLGPISMKKNASLDVTQLSKAQGTDIDGPYCQKGGSKRLNPVGLAVYNSTTVRLAYDKLKELVHRYPDFAASAIQLENYSLQVVRSVDPSTTAYAHRNDDVLV
jgi:hypothetical protein